MQKVLITGVNGFVGSYLAEQLVQKGYSIMGTAKGESRLTLNTGNFTYKPLDFTDNNEVDNVLATYSPDVVIHCGAMSKPDECELNREKAYLVNVFGTKKLLSAAANLKAHFVHLSTDFVFSGKGDVYKEEDSGDPVNYYGQTKLQAEAEVISYPFDWTVVRTVLVYGHPKAGRQNILTNVANALHEGKELNIYNDQFRTPTYVEDLVRGIVSIVERRATGVYHLSGEDILTPYQMARAVADYLNLNKELIKLVTAETFEQPALRPPRTVFDLSKAKKDLDYRATSFEEGLRKTFNG